MPLQSFEEGVILAAKFGRQTAVHFLLGRWDPVKNNVIRSLARKYHLSPQDVEDAQQEATLWLLEAIDRYRFGGDANASHRVRSFVRRMLANRLSNFARGLRNGGNTRLLREGETLVFHLRVEREQPCRDPENDPALIAERRDLLNHLHDQIAWLDPASQALYGHLVAGRSTQQAADELVLTYDQTRRLRERLVRRLALQANSIADD
ncbi:MAG: sigma factor [Planctomycetota bacterium]